MATITPIIDGYKIEYAWREPARLVKTYLVKGNPISSQLPKYTRPYGSDLTWPRTKDNAKLLVKDFWLDSIIYVSPTYSGNVFKMTVVAQTAHGDFIEGASSQPDETAGFKRFIINRRISSTPLRVTDEMIGLIRADKEDAGEIEGQDSSDTSFGQKYTDTDFAKLKLLPDNTTPVCNPGDYIYKNALPAKRFEVEPVSGRVMAIAVPGGASAGTADKTFAHFLVVPPSTDPTDANNPLKPWHRDVSLSCPLFSLQYFVLSNEDFTLNVPNHPNFCGWVSSFGPENGIKYGPMVGPKGPNLNGKWRCLEQEYSTDFDVDGTPLLSITRTFLHTPGHSELGHVDWGGPLYWNPKLFGKWQSPDWPAS